MIESPENVSDDASEELLDLNDLAAVAATLDDLVLAGTVLLDRETEQRIHALTKHLANLSGPHLG